MKTEKVIKSQTEDLHLNCMNKDEVLTIPEDMDDQEAAKRFKCSPVLVDTLLMLVSDIRELIGSDLKDIWQRLDRLEEKTKGS